MVTQFSEVDVSWSLNHAGYSPRGLDDDGNEIGDFGISFFDLNEPERSGWHTGHLSMGEISWYHNDPKPTEQQMIDWENERLTLLQQKKNLKEDIVVNLNAFNFSEIDYATSIRIQSVLISVFVNNNTPTLNLVYQGFLSELVGTTLENPIKNFVTMMTGISNFGLAIPDENKRDILKVVLQFLVCYQNAYESKLGGIN